MEALEPRLALAYSNYIAPDGASWPVDQNTGMPYFHSNVTATTNAYLDYDGDPGIRETKHNLGALPAYDTDNDPTHFLGSEERNTMWEQWRRTSTYLAPFDIDVTTQYADPTTKAVGWVAVSPQVNQFPAPYAHTGSFGLTDGWAQAFVAPNSAAVSIAHELGHLFGNDHSESSDEFFQEIQGYGGPSFSVNYGLTDSLNGAIMGSHSGVVDKYLIWNREDNFAQIQDAQGTIANKISSVVFSRFGYTISGYRPDDYVNTYGTSAATIGSGIPKKGIIETTNDVDYFKFSVTATSASYGISLTRDLNSPLDTTILVQNSTGGLVASYNGDTRAANKQMVNDANLMIPNLAIGTYYIRVTGNGNGGDVGPYLLRLDRFYDNQWRSSDIGQSVDGGYAYQISSLAHYTVRGSGADIWGSADGGHFLYKRLSGDGQMVASPMNFFQSYTSINEWAKIGIMMRSSLDPGAMHVSLFDTWSHGIQVLHRELPNGDTSQDYGSGDTPFVPNQSTRVFRLIRTGHLFQAWLSTDSGAHYTSLASLDLSGWGDTIYVGLVTMSHNDNWAVSGTFNNVSIVPLGAGTINPSGVTVDYSLPIPSAPLPFQNGGGSTTFSWTRVNDSNVVGYQVERSVNNIDWTMDAIVSQPASGNPSRTISFLNDNCYYYFRVRSRNAQGYVSDVGTSVGYCFIQPKAVSNLRSVVTAGGTVILLWTDAAGESEYRIEASDNYDAANPNAATWTTYQTMAANSMSWYDYTGQPIRRAYRIHTVQLGVVTATSSVLVTGRQIAPATNVAITGITQGDPGTMTLGWTAPAGVTGGVTYSVQYSTLRSPLNWSTAITGLTSTSYTMSTQAGKPYYFRIISQSTATGGRSPSAVVFRSSWGTNPSGYSDTDVGTVGGVGGVHAPNGTGGDIAVLGSGGDIWGTSDNMHYMYRSFSGFNSMIVHVGSFGSGTIASDQEWARAGIVFRSTTLSGSASVGLFTTPQHGIVFQTRNSSGGSTSFAATQVNPPTSFTPIWLKLQRNSSNTFSAYYSYNSTTGFDGNWVLWATTTASISNIYYGGLAVSSHDNSYMYTANFDHLVTY